MPRAGRSYLSGPFFFFFDFFDVDHFEVCIEFVTMLLLFHVLLFWSLGMWDLSSPTRDRTPCIGRGSLNQWTAREVPLSGPFFFKF